MKNDKPITLRRACEAVQVPSGSKIILEEGVQVKITQALGGTFTAVTDQGSMVRIASKDADALGEIPSEKVQADVSVGEEREVEIEERVWDQLKTCFDPEIPVNIADLGLVYSCFITPIPGGGNQVEIKMTLTAPGCGMGDSIKADVESKILSVPGVNGAEVELVWDPPWDRSMISEAAKLELGMM